MEWVLIIMMWWGQSSALPEDGWAGRAVRLYEPRFATYEKCMEAKERVYASLNGKTRANLACVPREQLMSDDKAY